jgi:hypothetical protein
MLKRTTIAEMSNQWLMQKKMIQEDETLKIEPMVAVD